MREERQWARAFASALLPALLAGCRSEAPAAPPDDVETRRFESPALDVALVVPASFSVHQDEAGVVFRHAGRPAIRLLWLDEERGRERGLWFGHEARPATIAGRPGARYDYMHWDGPLRSRTVSYVVPYRGRELGLEFRTDARPLPPVYRRVVESLELEVGGPAARAPAAN